MKYNRKFYIHDWVLVILLGQFCYFIFLRNSFYTICVWGDLWEPLGQRCKKRLSDLVTYAYINLQLAATGRVKGNPWHKNIRQLLFSSEARTSGRGCIAGHWTLKVVLHGCCCWIGGPPARMASHDGALGGGEVDGVDAHGESLLQVVEDVGADAGAGHGALCWSRLVQKLLEAVELNQQHHVLQEIALDESRKLRGTKELHRTKKMHRQGNRVVVFFLTILSQKSVLKCGCSLFLIFIVLCGKKVFWVQIRERTIGTYCRLPQYLLHYNLIIRQNV